MKPIFKQLPNGKFAVRRANPKGRLDIAAFRVLTEHILPVCERTLQIPGLAAVLKPHAEALIAEHVPAVNVFQPPKRKRRFS